MKTVRFLSNILCWLSRIMSLILLLIVLYAAIVLMLHAMNPTGVYPITVDNGTFKIFYPFSHTTFLLGDYTIEYLFSYLLTLSFYGIFLWLLSNVFQSFTQQKIFTRIGALRLSRFYIINFIVPALFIAMVLVLGQSIVDMLRIIMLHLVIGIFAFFMAAIFKQGLELQDEQDLIF